MRQSLVRGSAAVVAVVGIVAMLGGCGSGGDTSAPPPAATQPPPVGGTPPGSVATTKPPGSVATSKPPSSRPTSQPPTTSEPPGDGTTSRDRQRQLAKQELEAGLIAYNPPSDAKVHEEFQVTARIQRGQLTTLPSLGNLPGTAPVQIDKLPVGTILRADLDGPGFDVELIGEQKQPLIEDTDYAEWAWKVDPQYQGHNTLRLTVAVEVDDQPLSNKVFERDIEVSVEDRTTFARIAGWNGWNEILIGLIVAAITGATSVVIARRRSS